MQYLLDTNICVFFLRGKLNLDRIINEKGRQNCYISEVTVMELRYGAESSNNPAKSHQAVDAFLSGVSIIPISSCIKRYAKEKVRLRKIGKPLHDEFDLLIGATAIENKLVLVTDNTSDFQWMDDKNGELVCKKIGINLISALPMLHRLLPCPHVRQ